MQKHSLVRSSRASIHPFSPTSDPRFPSESFENFRRRSGYRVALNMNKRFMRTRWLQGGGGERERKAALDEGWYPNKSRSTAIGVDLFSIFRVPCTRSRSKPRVVPPIINRRRGTRVRTSSSLSSLSSRRVIIPEQSMDRLSIIDTFLAIRSGKQRVKFFYSLFSFFFFS